jgi:hypothetical protein
MSKPAKTKDIGNRCEACETPPDRSPGWPHTCKPAKTKETCAHRECMTLSNMAAYGWPCLREKPEAASETRTKACAACGCQFPIGTGSVHDEVEDCLEALRAALKDATNNVRAGESAQLALEATRAKPKKAEEERDELKIGWAHTVRDRITAEARVREIETRMRDAGTPYSIEQDKINALVLRVETLEKALREITEAHPCDCGSTGDLHWRACESMRRGAVIAAAVLKATP